ncbi:MAG: hypothetical protein VB042_05385 [Victivallaceae bacterium]|nr:hypothetical protein [Victivallaceae bacterium]
MADDVVVNGAAVLAFGTASASIGVYESVTDAEEAEKKVVTNHLGQTITVIHYDHRRKVSGELTPLAAASGAFPVDSGMIIGQKLALPTMQGQTVEIIIDAASKKYAKGDILTWSVEGYYYPAISVTP